MKKTILSAVVTCCSLTTMLAQTPYKSYLSGDAADVTTAHKSGIVLAGGGTDNDDAMRWMLARADGGDVVVLRTNESDGYNSYFFSELGVKVNSVETLVVASTAAANDPYIIKQIRNAEVVFIAGGDQTRYKNYWSGTGVQDALNYIIKEKKGMIGGTSAGMAILGGVYYAPKYDGVIADEALANPYHKNMTGLGKGDFILYPLLLNILTDTHYDQRNRPGRHLAMLARIEQDWKQKAFGIACDEQTAVCVDESGIGKVFSANFAGENYAYFLQSNCATTATTPETCVDGKPLTWSRTQQAVKAYRIAGDKTGSGTFNLNDWRTGTGGAWMDWYAENGVFTSKVGTPPCISSATSVHDVASELAFSIFPNPASEQVRVNLTLAKAEQIRLSVINLFGQEIGTAFDGIMPSGSTHISFSIVQYALAVGNYFCRLQRENGSIAVRSFFVVK